MDTTKTNNTRQRLTAEREKLIKSMNRNRTTVGEIKTENTEDEGDLAVMSHDKELLNKLNEGDFAQLKFIENAIEALDRGEYGECAVCEEPISEKRLIAVPWATLCIRCQEASEQEHESSRMVAMGAEEAD